MLINQLSKFLKNAEVLISRAFQLFLVFCYLYNTLAIKDYQMVVDGLLVARFVDIWPKNLTKKLLSKISETRIATTFHHSTPCGFYVKIRIMLKFNPENTLMLYDTGTHQQYGANVVFLGCNIHGTD